MWTVLTLLFFPPVGQALAHLPAAAASVVETATQDAAKTIQDLLIKFLWIGFGVLILVVFVYLLFQVLEAWLIHQVVD